MAKDPAVLFYTSDFLVGTYSFTDTQTGQYIRLLCLQHQQGHLPKDVVMDVLHGNEDMKIISKFKVDADGLYYNERMDSEAARRMAYAKSRSENRTKKPASDSHEEHMKQISKSYVPHMETVTVTDTNNVPTPLLGDEEMDALASGINDVLDAAERAGFPRTQADLDRLNQIVADYHPEPVLNAIDRAVDAGTTTRTWRYLLGILKSDPTGGAKPKEEAYTPKPHWEDEG